MGGGGGEITGSFDTKKYITICLKLDRPALLQFLLHIFLLFPLA
jgi:hypothetical protein